MPKSVEENPKVRTSEMRENEDRKQKMVGHPWLPSYTPVYTQTKITKNNLIKYIPINRNTKKWWTIKDTGDYTQGIEQIRCSTVLFSFSSCSNVHHF